ncbi:MAG: hypothetical protein IJG02_07240, partial [Thermoguttaceae bacterium]|nr:hypothetical protein [Thermoguttaceae bacterium]
SPLPTPPEGGAYFPRRVRVAWLFGRSGSKGQRLFRPVVPGGLAVRPRGSKSERLFRLVCSGWLWLFIRAVRRVNGCSDWCVPGGFGCSAARFEG